jgi:nitroreductase
MPVNPQLLDHLLSRRSIGMPFLAEPGPTAAELETLLTIATRVPDHGKLVPFRLILIAGEARVEAGRRLAEIAARLHPEYDAAALEVEARRFLPAPLTIGVVSTARHHQKIPQWEQFLVAGNVAFNLLHGAAALGFGATWVSRWYSLEGEPAEMLGARYGEQFVGFVSIGTATAKMEDRPRPQLADVVTHWTPGAAG